MDDQDYILDEYQYRTLMAIRDIADNAFCGYPDGHGYDEEQELAKDFVWLVRDFIALLDASKQPVDEYVENRPYLYRLMKQQELLRMQREINSK